MDTVIGSVQAKIDSFLTADVISALEVSAQSAIDSSRKDQKAKNHISYLGDLLHTRGVVSSMIGIKAPKGETPEGEALRVEFTRQIVEDYLEPRYPTAWVSALAFDLDGKKKEVNDARKKAGLSNMTAPEMEEAGLIKAGTIDDRNAANRCKSQFLTRLAGHLAKLEPKVEEVEEVAEGETIEPTPSAKTPKEQMLNDIQNAIKHGKKDESIPDGVFTTLYQIVALLGGSVDFDAE